MKKDQLLKNTTSLMIFNITKMLFPIVTLPYLTRILSTEAYGTVAYVKTIMTYMQIFVDFGFMLSATKNIVKVKDDSKKMSRTIGDTLIARIVLGVIGGVIVVCMAVYLPILKKNILYTLLSYIVVFQSIFLMDFVFRGLETMYVITIRFVVMKTLSTVLTFVFVKNESNMLLIPIFDILSSFLAIILVIKEMRRMKIKIMFSNFSNSIHMIKESFVFFLSNVASTSFNALSTLIIGVQISASDVAYWSVCMQIIGSLQACYSPISDGIYPEMVRSKNINLMKKVLKVLIPVALVGCIVCFLCADFGMEIIGGKEYVVAAPIFRLLIPCIFFGFLAMMFGWPTLGVIDKTKETTFTTIASVLIHILLLVWLIIENKFTLVNIAIVRSIADFMLFFMRYMLYLKFRTLFSNEK